MKFSKKAVSVVGKLLMAASLVFIVLQITRHDVDFSILVSPFVIIGLLVTALAFGFGIIFAGLNFRWLIGNITGVSVGRLLVVKAYCISNLYKYLPGSVMYLIGRNRIAFETKKVSHAQVAFATVMEGILILLATVIVIAVSVSDEAIYYVRQVDIPYFVWIIAGSIVLICAVLILIFRRRLGIWFSKFSNDMKSFRPVSKAKRLGTCLLIVIVLAVTYLVTLMLLGQQITLDMVPTIIGLYLLAWLAGFMTPGAGGGMGVREFVLYMFLGSYLDAGIVLSSAVMHRLITIMGDVFAYGFILVYSRVRK
ncbi:MAG: lysylphosphatidylglycerol synthase domain-containing protein [Treponema sp.]|nr:lysylphosphatidylglycerol synthase domain-containing protein [Treponema sp.]